MGTYRFNCALQANFKTVVSANGEDVCANGEYDSPPTAKEAIIVVEQVRQKGEEALSSKAHKDFNAAINKVIGWLEHQSNYNSGYTPSGNGDITEARKEFEYKGTLYRVDIKPGGKTSEGGWFL